MDEALELLGQRGGRLEIFPLFIGQASVGIAGDIAAGQGLQSAQMVGHELRPGGAVQSQRNQIEVVERSPQSLDALSRQHGAHGLDSDGDHKRDIHPELARQALHGQSAGFYVARVLTGFQQQQVHTTIDQRARLLEIGLLELGEGDAAGDRDGLRGRTHGTRDKAGLCGGRELVRGPPGQLGGNAIDRVGLLLQLVFRQNNRGAAKGVGLDDVGARFEVLAMNIEDDLRLADHEVFVAAVQRRSAKVRSRGVALLDHRSHGAIQNEDALVKQAPEDTALLREVPHLRSRS